MQQNSIQFFQSYTKKKLLLFEIWVKYRFMAEKQISFITLFASNILFI